MPHLQHSLAVRGYEPGARVCSLIAVNTARVAAERTFQDAMNAAAERTC